MKTSNANKAIRKRIPTPRVPKAKNIDSGCQYLISIDGAGKNIYCNFEVENFDADKPYCIFHLPKFTALEKTAFSVDDQLISTNEEKTFEAKFRDLVLNTEEIEFINFRGFIFPEFFNFTAPFNTKADFSSAVFLGYVNFAVEFENPKPEHEYDLTRMLLLKNGGLFKNTIFKDKANFQSCEIDGDLDFERAIFEKDAVFSRLNCNGDAKFEYTSFNGSAEFDMCSFKDVTFYNTKFNSKTDFTHFSVEENTRFTQVIFEKNVDFFRSEFGTLTSKYNEDGKKIEIDKFTSTNFDNAVFNERVVFYDVGFHNELSFDSAIFKKETVFAFYRFGTFGDVSSFRWVTLPKDETFTFDKVNLNRTRFHDTNIEKIVFRDVSWATETKKLNKLFRGSQYILWDEIRPIDGMQDYHDESKTAENYRQLVINYESKRDYETAEYFHIGEMEMRRRKVGEKIYPENYEPSKLGIFLDHPLKFYRVSNVWEKLRKYINGYGLYWLSSRYGTSYTQAFAVLLVLILLYSLLFLYSGIKSSSEVSLDNQQIIEYNLIPDLNHPIVPPKKIFTDYIETVSYTFSIITFQKERFYQPLDWEGRFLLYSAVLTLTAQSALVLLAIRRQFRR